MIPHHQQAIEMAELVKSHTDRPELHKLADGIITSQGQEVAQPQGWLRSWDKPAVPMEGHGGMEVRGTMSEADMSRLMEATGAEFDVAFVEMMADHHQGAIDMANDELNAGSLPEAKQLAQQVIDTQQEIEQLERWKEGWSATQQGKPGPEGGGAHALLPVPPGRLLPGGGQPGYEGSMTKRSMGELERAVMDVLWDQGGW